MVPQSLRIMFVIHFVADMVFAIPLFVAPQAFLALFGWTSVDPVVSRVVAAALVGIGGESLWGRKADLASFRTMCRLKILWSATACLGFILSLIQGAPWGTWIFLAIFVAFCATWTTFFFKLRAMPVPAPAPAS